MIALMILIHLIILLTIGVGVGYWILVTANNNEGRLKTIGEYLGFILIAIVILFAILGAFYSMKFADSDYMQNMMQQQIQKHDKEENESVQNDEKNQMIDNNKSEESEEKQEDIQGNENKSNNGSE